MDVLTDSQRKYCMSQIQGKDTGPELRLRKALWSSNLRYRLRNNLPGKPDIFFPRVRLAIFVDGCFWHRCTEHCQIPKKNRDFWSKKINGNVERDRRIDRQLQDRGWKVLRLWEHDIQKNLDNCVTVIRDKILEARAKAERQSPIRFIDLFCGGGLGARGASNAGASPILAVDAWSLAAQTYKENFPETDVINARIEDLDPAAVLGKYPADVLLASPECTSHSIARGAKVGCEKSRETALNILPWIRAASPRWVIVENVSRMRQWGRHLELKQRIENLGYKVSEFVVNAADLGVPQARRRLFLVCDREGKPPKREDLQKYYVSPVKTARSIIDWNGRWKTAPLFAPGRASNTLDRAGRAIQALGHGVPFIIVYYGSDYAGGWQPIDAPLRTITTLDRFALVTFTKGEYRMRMLQPPELLKAMGAENHSLPVGTRRDKVRLCGNGVCSAVIEMIFNEIIRITFHDRTLDERLRYG